MGSEDIRRPVALATAPATAAIVGQMLTSPTPLTPNGWFGFGHSTTMVSMYGRSDATGMR